MSKVQVNFAKDAKVFLSQVDRIKTDELEHFVRELNGIISQRKLKDGDYRGRMLLRLINEKVLPAEKLERYLTLSAKMDAETMNEAERLEFLGLVAEEESLRNERVRLLIELSQIRGIPLTELMEEMGLFPPGRA